MSEPHECVESGSRTSVHRPGQTAAAESREAELPVSPTTYRQRLRLLPLSPVVSRKAQGNRYPNMSWAHKVKPLFYLPYVIAGRETKPSPVTYR